MYKQSLFMTVQYPHLLLLTETLLEHQSISCKYPHPSNCRVLIREERRYQKRRQQGEKLFVHPLGTKYFNKKTTFYAFYLYILYINYFLLIYTNQLYVNFHYMFVSFRVVGMDQPIKFNSCGIRLRKPTRPYGLGPIFGP